MIYIIYLMCISILVCVNIKASKHRNTRTSTHDHTYYLDHRCLSGDGARQVEARRHALDASTGLRSPHLLSCRVCWRAPTSQICKVLAC